MTLKKITLELARTDEFPEGSPDCGYEFIAPLNDDGLLDQDEWKSSRDKCSVKRFWKHEDDENGMLVHHRGNAWVFSYIPDETDDDEPIFKFDQHKFLEGEYVSITEHDGVQRPFRIVKVEE